MQTFVIYQPDFRHGQRVYQPGDRYGPKDYSDLTEQSLYALQVSSHILPLTRVNYGLAIGRRPDGADVGRGFTRAELVAMDILDPLQADAAPAPKKPAASADAPAPKPRPKLETVLGEPEPYGDFFLRTKKVGHFQTIDVLDKDGALLREKAFKKREAATAFLDGLAKPAEAA